VSIVCDNVRDPGNMAAIITAATATSSSQILVTKGLVDIAIYSSQILVTKGLVDIAIYCVVRFLSMVTFLLCNASGVMMVELCTSGL